MRKETLTALSVGFAMGIVPQFVMASNISWDEFAKFFVGGGGMGIAAIIFAIKGKNPHA